jgi:hypothetical protein
VDVEGNWVPGKRITDRQVNEYKRYRLANSQETAAAKAGMSVRTARRVEQASALSSQREPRAWRTREDPLAAVWDTEVVPLLERDAQLNGVTLLEELQRRHPGQYPQAVLRTLQRRLRQWRALHGAEREVYFAQEHPPGRLGLSDFTVANDLEVKIGGASFDHRLYQFALAHSGWRHAEVVEGGESFLALSSGLQAALWRLGGVPEEHRTDSLSAAFNNLAECEELTRRYEGLCAHYGMRASRCNPGQSHENGSIEARNGSLKAAIDQALRLRGSRKFQMRIPADRDRLVRERDRLVRERDRPVRDRDRGSSGGVRGLRMTQPRVRRLPAFCRSADAPADDGHTHDQGRIAAQAAWQALARGGRPQPVDLQGRGRQVCVAGDRQRPAELGVDRHAR